jgi:flagellin
MFSSSAANSIYNINRQGNIMDSLLSQIQSGNRINKAADDSSGLTIADNLRMQHSSLAQGTKNALDAKSMLNIVDGAVTSFKDTIQLMKNKAVSAGSDASSSDSRVALQKDIINFMKSLNDIASQTSYNGVNMLDGSFTNKQFQVGAYSNQTVNISLNSLSTNKIGHLSESVGTAVTAGTTAATLSVNGATISQVTTSGTTKDGANLIAEAINAQKVTSGVTATATNSVNGGAVVGGAIANGDLSINGISIGAVVASSSDATGSLSTAINSISNQTGVSASVVAGKLELTSLNGENIHITEANGGAAKAGLTAGTNFGKVTLQSANSISIANATAVSGLNATTDTNYTLSDVDLRTTAGAQRAISIIDNALKEANNNASNVGAATNQLDRRIEINNVTEQNVKAAEATIREANLEEVSSQLADLQVKQQASIFSLSKSNEIQQNVLSLLR